jgi:TrmH family RNA methyltransferase
MLTSPANPHLTAARRLADRKHRQEEQRFLVEGLRLIEDGWRSGVRPHQLFYDEAQVAGSAPAQRLLAEMTAAQVTLLPCSPAAFATLSQTVTPQGLAAVMPLPALPWPALPTLLLLFDGVRDPGNAGTLLRSAEAAGVEGVIFGPHSVDPFNEKVVRAGMGVHFRLPLHLCPAEAQLDAALGALPLFVAEGTAALAYDQVDWRRPAILAVGNEAAGPSPTARMAGRTESLNAAIAGSVILFEAARQRRRGGG